MTTDMKTLREALDHLKSTSLDSVESWECALPHKCAGSLSAAIDELEALRGAFEMARFLVSHDMEGVRAAWATIDGCNHGAVLDSHEREPARATIEDALDELEALRGQVAYAESLDTLNQRLRAESAERGLDECRAQRDELLAALEGALGRCERCRDQPYGDCADCYDDRKTLANARGGQ